MDYLKHNYQSRYGALLESLKSSADLPLNGLSSVYTSFKPLYNIEQDSSSYYQPASYYPTKTTYEQQGPYQNSSYLNFNVRPELKTYDYSSYKPLTTSSTRYSSANTEPYSIFSRYLSSQPSTLSYEPTFRYRDSTLFNEEPAYKRESISQNYNHGRHRSTARFNDRFEQLHKPLTRSSSVHVGSYFPKNTFDTTYPPLSSYYPSLHDSGLNRITSYQSTTPAINFDYRKSELPSLGRHHSYHQVDSPHTSRVEQEEDPTVVAASNVVSSRTSVQRDLGDDYRPSSIARNSRSTTPSNIRLGYKTPHRSQSVAIDNLNNRISLAYKPQSNFNDISSVRSSHRHSSVLPNKRSTICPGRSSIVGSSTSMFQVDTSKRSSQAGKERYSTADNKEGRSTGSGRHRQMLERYMIPERSSISENSKRWSVNKRDSKTEARSSKCIEDNSNFPRVRSYTGSIYGVNIPDSFTPTISDTRRKARDVLCKIRNDPTYFSFR